MARYSVPMTTYANTAVEVEVPDDMTDPEQIAQLAAEQNDPPRLCHNCVGGRRGGQELELGDDWEPSRLDGQAIATRLS